MKLVKDEPVELAVANLTEVSPDTQAVLLLCSALGASGDPAPLTNAEYNRLAAWLAGNRLRPGDLLDAGEADLPDGGEQPSAERLRALLGRGRLLGLALEKWANFGIAVVSRADPAYPVALRRLQSAAPPLLFVAGSSSLLNHGGVAIVGSRDADESSLEFAHDVAGRCAAGRITVISGGARGVDREGLTGAIEAGGRAIAVPADGMLKLITERLAREAIAAGQLTVAAPNDPETGFTVGRAMGRNKIVYGLADYGLVVHFAKETGGTWAGAVERLKHNRSGQGRVPVFVRVLDESDTGWRQLRAQGALPFPADRLHHEPIETLLANGDEPASGSERPLNAPPTSTAEVLINAPPAGQDTCYVRCVDLILSALEERPTKKDLAAIAKRLELTTQQFGLWMDRAISEGKVVKEKCGRKVIYRRAMSVNGGSLFLESEAPTNGTANHKS